MKIKYKQFSLEHKFLLNFMSYSSIWKIDFSIIFYITVYLFVHIIKKLFLSHISIFINF